MWFATLIIKSHLSYHDYMIRLFPTYPMLVTPGLPPLTQCSLASLHFTLFSLNICPYSPTYVSWFSLLSSFPLNFLIKVCFMRKLQPFKYHSPSLPEWYSISSLGKQIHSFSSGPYRIISSDTLLVLERFLSPCIPYLPPSGHLSQYVYILLILWPLFSFLSLMH